MGHKISPGWLHDFTFGRSESSVNVGPRLLEEIIQKVRWIAHSFREDCPTGLSLPRAEKRRNPLVNLV